MANPSSKLTGLLTGHVRAEGLSLIDWDLIVRQARVTKLNAALWFSLEESGQLGDVPDLAKNHLMSGAKQADRIKIAARYELSLIDKVVKDFDAPVIVLKGAAYLQRQFNFSRGRVFSDIDILVPEERIGEVEKLFLEKGWKTGKQDPYDQEYYRKWMHELPPMVNPKTANYLDLHHSILPKTSTIKVNPRKLILNSHKLDGFENLYTFSSEDIVLHSATHLFHEGEFENGLRDLYDIYSLITEFNESQEDFWRRLIKRAEELQLVMPLSYSLGYCNKFLKLELPTETLDWLKSRKAAHRFVMDQLFHRALEPDHISCDDWLTPSARWLLYVRSHYLRMPLYLLIPHLVRKAYKKRFDESFRSDAN